MWNEMVEDRDHDGLLGSIKTVGSLVDYSTTLYQILTLCSVKWDAEGWCDYWIGRCRPKRQWPIL